MNFLTNDKEKNDRLPSDISNMIKILPDVLEQLFNLLVNITGIFY